MGVPRFVIVSKEKVFKCILGIVLIFATFVVGLIILMAAYDSDQARMILKFIFSDHAEVFRGVFFVLFLTMGFYIFTDAGK